MKTRRVSLLAALAVVVAVLAFGVSPAFAESACSACKPWWHLTSGSRPSDLQPESKGQVVVTVVNLGDADADGEANPIEVVDRLPAGLKALNIKRSAVGDLDILDPVKCSLSSTQLVECAFAGKMPPYLPMEIIIDVEALAGAAPGESNEVSVSGGGALGAHIARAVQIGEETTPFGVENYELVNENEGGTADTQAGSHPFQQTTTITLNQTLSSQNFGVTPAPAKDLNFKWPAGLIGNPTPFPRCPLARFLASEAMLDKTGCPADTAVGVAKVVISTTLFEVGVFVVPLFNLEPAVGEPARLGFKPGGVPVYIDASIRGGEDYGVTVSVHNVSEEVDFLSSEVTVWGVPGDPRHASWRGNSCLEANSSSAKPPEVPCTLLEEQHPPPFLSLPTSCTGSSQSSMDVSSWTQPGMFVEPREPFAMPALDGCNRLPFESALKLTPDGMAASTPTGLNVDTHVAQEEALNPTGLAPSDVRSITVALPEGVAINPAGGDGLQACSESQVGFTGFQEYLPGTRTPTFTPRLPGSVDALAAGETEPLRPGVNFCQDASKIATAKIRTPLLPNAIEGAVYLATPAPNGEGGMNPFNALVAMYIVAEDPVSGVLVKLPGQVALDPVTGRLVATFEDTPQAPFEDAELHFFGGDRAPLATPARCGSYTATATFAPWSGNEPSQLSSNPFEVLSGPDGGGCPEGGLPFAPTLTAGTTSIQAGGFSPFTMTMSREDGQQNLQGITLKMPPGLSGVLTGVKLCGEAEANAGTCGAESLIGETVVSVGLGGDPYSVKGGKVYITGPYKGAPFGLSIVNPAVAGPFNLGEVVVRAKLEVNEETAAITVVTDTEGPYEIPTILDGIPLQIKHVNVTINRPGFIFNPSNCTPLAVTGSLQSTEGATDQLSVPFQVTNCAVLAFKPKLTAATTGKTSRANGASFNVKLGYPAGPYDANIARVKVELPKALPSRLTTLQKACTAAVFDANPAACPPASIVGHATATTPEIPVPLSGPAYFVSHGGEAFPSLIIVLQGYGVTVHLVGSTFIDKAGITSSTFKTVPDAPVGTFELTLPQGPYSALAATGNFCKEKLAMPTEFVGQNGALIKTTTKIAVTGCAKHKAKHAKKARGHRRKRKK
jgi:hypothetical protein